MMFKNIKDINLENPSSWQDKIFLTLEVGCDTYMAGGGASEYQNIDLFYESGLKFVYQDFVHPVYKQHNAEDFIKGLSVIDYIFNARETYEI